MYSCRVLYDDNLNQLEMKQIETEILINADIETVWRVLTEFQKKL